MTIIGSTQYRTRVQGMPEDVMKHLRNKMNNFLWGGNTPMVGLNQTRLERDEGGLRLIDLEARNDAIKLMRLKAYLTMGPKRPKWAYAADRLLALNIPRKHRVLEPGSSMNMFLQSWEATTRGDRSRAPKTIREMVKTAKKYGVKFVPGEMDNNTRDSMPLWFHIGFDESKKRNQNSKTAVCLRTMHEIATV
ncbi:hypothetical protein BKA70DRAFT_1123464, partial [Coprinopsis sp. MPI-PUGE-AT-0042]